MSERYGPCPRCHGKGVVFELPHDFQGVPTWESDYEEKECGRCDGTGQDGSAETYSDLSERWTALGDT